MKTLKVLVHIGFIALGALVGSYLSSASSGGVFLGGAVLGGVLAGLIYFLIQLALSRQTSEPLPSTRPGERNQVHSQGDTQTSEAQITRARDTLLGENMPRH